MRVVETAMGGTAVGVSAVRQYGAVGYDKPAARGKETVRGRSCFANAVLRCVICAVIICPIDTLTCFQVHLFRMIVFKSPNDTSVLCSSLFSSCNRMNTSLSCVLVSWCLDAVSLTASHRELAAVPRLTEEKREAIETDYVRVCTVLHSYDSSIHEFIYLLCLHQSSCHIFPCIAVGVCVNFSVQFGLPTCG